MGNFIISGAMSMYTNIGEIFNYYYLDCGNVERPKTWRP